MRVKLILAMAACLVSATFTTSIARSAQTASSPMASESSVVKRGMYPGPYQPIDFQAVSPCEGCIGFANWWADGRFPVVNGAFARFVRMYMSDVSFDDVTEDSMYVEMWIGQRPDGVFFIADSRLGNMRSGARYFFKVALVDGAGRILYFMADDEVDRRNHSVVVR